MLNIGFICWTGGWCNNEKILTLREVDDDRVGLDRPLFRDILVALHDDYSVAHDINSYPAVRFCMVIYGTWKVRFIYHTALATM